MIAQIPSFSSLGVVVAVVGLGLVCFFVLAYLIRPQPIRESFLAPTLGIDAIEPDLRVLYLKTLVFEAERHQDHDAVRIGREMRRLIFVLQSEREAGQDHTETVTWLADLLEGSSEPSLPDIVKTRKTLSNQQDADSVEPAIQQSH